MDSSCVSRGSPCADRMIEPETYRIDKSTIIGLLKEVGVVEFDYEMSVDELMDFYEETCEKIDREAQERLERIEICVYMFLLVRKGKVTIEESNRLLRPEASNAEIIKAIKKYV
jgi:hypothetical protein